MINHPHLIDNYSCWDRPKRKKHPLEILEEEQLYFKMIQEQQKILLEKTTNQQINNVDNLVVISSPAAGAGHDYFNGELLELWNWDEPDIVINNDGSKTIAFKTINGKVQQIQKNSNFPTGSWTDLTSPIIGDGNSVIIANDSINESSSFYRVKIGTTHVSAYVGFYKKNFPASSSNVDTQWSLPFSRKSKYIGTVNYVTGSTVGVSFGMVDNELTYDSASQQTQYYVHFRSGNKVGFQYDVASNTANTLTVNLVSESLDGINSGDVIAVIPHWSFDTVFPSGSGVVKTIQTQLSKLKSSVMLFDVNNIGINKSAIKTMFYFSGSGITEWRGVAESTNSGSAILNESEFFVNRSSINSSSIATFYGRVHMEPWRIKVNTSSSKNDINIGVPRPVPMSFNDLKLVEQGLFDGTTDVASPTDELRLYLNNTGANRSPQVYYLTGSSLVLSGSDYSHDYKNDKIIDVADGFVIRKNSGSLATYNWICYPNYL